MHISKAPIIVLLALIPMAGPAEAQSQTPAAPVAIDQACADLVNQSRGMPDSALASGHEPGGDKFRGVHPDIDDQAALDPECEQRRWAAVRILLRQIVVRRVRKARKIHPFDLGVFAKVLCDSKRVVTVPFHPERQGLQALQDKESAHRAEC